MANLECPECGAAVTKDAAICGACGRELHELKEEEGATPEPGGQEKGPGRQKVYAILAVLLVALGGAALLVLTGLLPNPMKGDGATAAIVNGEKISVAEVDQKVALYQKMSGKGAEPDSLTPEGKAAAAGMRTQILNRLIQEKILVTEAAKEKITVPPQEVADKIAAIKKNLSLSDKDFDAFLQQHGMSIASFEKRIERDLLIERMIARGTEKGLTKNGWMEELQKRAKVERLAK